MSALAWWRGAVGWAEAIAVATGATAAGGWAAAIWDEARESFTLGLVEQWVQLCAQ